MSAQPEPPIGERIREERLLRGYNLRTLARAVNVSASHISQIENGKCRPSVSTLYAITSVLGVSIDDLFEGATTPVEAGSTDPEDTVADDLETNPRGSFLPENTVDLPGKDGDRSPRKGPSPSQIPAALIALASEHARRMGPIVGPSEREVLELDSGVKWDRLGHVPGLHVDFLLITYAPGGSSSSTAQLMRHPGTEYGYLISGELTVTLGFSEHKIVAGDAICFSSATPHRYRNDGTEPAVGVWFQTAPDSMADSADASRNSTTEQ
ncbi:MAG TPA: XRE family transcriptional regulator [Streptosporangiaceae bacterium]|nr:XRE family transcriptional regulator [Streptosporangiaceae bacterium]